MKIVAVTAYALSTLFLAAPAVHSQTADDKKWVNECIQDNQDQGQTAQTIRTYCTCMNDQMSETETQTITQWEKTHKKEADMCSSKAGWKG
jgi:hypothetical protein